MTSSDEDLERLTAQLLALRTGPGITAARVPRDAEMLLKLPVTTMTLKEGQRRGVYPRGKGTAHLAHAAVEATRCAIGRVRSLRYQVVLRHTLSFEASGLDLDARRGAAGAVINRTIKTVIADEGAAYAELADYLYFASEPPCFSEPKAAERAESLQTIVAEVKQALLAEVMAWLGSQADPTQREFAFRAVEEAHLPIGARIVRAARPGRSSPFALVTLIEFLRSTDYDEREKWAHGFPLLPLRALATFIARPRPADHLDLARSLDEEHSYGGTHLNVEQSAPGWLFWSEIGRSLRPLATELILMETRGWPGLREWLDAPPQPARRVTPRR
ncbi:hypothetical protein [Nocardioides sp. KR10-350]|uniref:hypothetical protein n=1 Tax=Nocardioides cheoyonin TaxID=3156615 RepID=UPI0032B37CF4